MRRSARPTITLAVLLAFSAATAAYGITTSRTADDGVIDSALDEHGHNHSQHGGGDGHLPPESDSVRVVGSAAINQDVEGRVADVGVLGNYAYLGAFDSGDCKKGGTYVFDISDPTAPTQVNFIRAQNDSYVGEGVQVVHLDTASFTGDVLAQNLEICGNTRTGAQGGFNLFDVTTPTSASLLAHAGDFDPAGANGASVAHTYHSVFVWQDGDRAYLVGVDNEEAADVDIFDITDPTRPELVVEYDLNQQLPRIGDAVKGLSESFLHDMVVKDIRGKQIMLLSYWDGGYVTLDVSRDRKGNLPATPKYVGDTDFAAVDPVLFAATGDERVPEGNAHQAEFSRDNDLIVAADEDFDPFALTSLTDEGAAFWAGQGSDTPALEPGNTIQGQAVYVGRACSTDPAVPVATAEGQVAVAERGACFFTDKVTSVEAANSAAGPDYAAVLIVNRDDSEGPDGCEDTLNMTVAGGIPAFGVSPRSVGYDLFDLAGYDPATCRSAPSGALLPLALGAVGDVVTFDSYFDGWGYVHLFENGRNKLQELDQYAIPQAHDQAYASGYGDLSVHEVAMSHQRNDLAYLAYYSGGFRVLRIAGDQLVESGAFIAEGGSNFWGVEVFEKDGTEYVAASDRDYGLYIFEYTGD